MSQRDSTRDIKMLNAEQIAARRIPLEDAELNLSKSKNWHCHYCNRRFTGEMTFMKHHCEPKRRAQELMSPIGQAAFGYYREWMRLKRYSQPGSMAFLESRYYRAFINFAQLVQDANIANPDKYIHLMIEGDLLPILWCRASCYSIYLDWVDRMSDPLDEVAATVNYLYDIAEKENVDLKNIFQHIGAARIISLIRQRRLSPWFLFCSKKFGALLKTLDSEQLKAFNTVVNSSHWAKKFEENKSVVNDIIQISGELEL